MLLSPSAKNSLNNIEKIDHRILITSFNGNPATTIVSCYSPTNIAEEDSVTQFFDELSSIVRNVPKHNVLLIGGDTILSLVELELEARKQIRNQESGIS